jgi:mannose-6-phosphate isomerase-like protein (cupin superfamily)
MNEDPVAPQKRPPDRAVHIPADRGSHRKGEWSGSVSGEALGADAIILFVVSDAIGDGPSLHVHPYDEIFIVTEGRARFRIGDEVIDASAGDVLKGPANVPHAYENLGPGRLSTTDIHLSRTWIQTDLVDG